MNPYQEKIHFLRSRETGCVIFSCLELGQISKIENLLMDIKFRFQSTCH